MNGQTGGKDSGADSGRELAVRNRVLEMFLSVNDQRWYEEVLNLVLEVMESRRGVFGYINERGDMVVPAMTRDIRDQGNIAQKAVAIPADRWGESGWSRAIREKRTICSNEISTSLVGGHIAVTRHLSLPIIHRGEAVGLMQVGDKETGYRDDDVAFFESVGSIIAPFLTVRLERDREERERRRMELALRESESINRCIVENIPQKIFLKDRDSVYMSVNQAYAGSLGLKPPDFVGQDDLSFYPVDMARKYQADDQAVMLSGQVQDIEEAFMAEGRQRVVHTVKVPVRNDAGEVFAVLGVFEDITERKQREEELRKYQEGLEKLVSERTAELNAANERLKAEDWVKSGIVALRETVGGDLDMETLASRAISKMAQTIDAQVGAIYIPRSDTDAVLSLVGTYAWSRHDGASSAVEPGEGLVGQAVLEKRQIFVNNVPEGYLKVTSGLGNLTVRQLCVVPFLLEDRVKGVVELGMLEEITDCKRTYLSQAMMPLAVAVASAQARALQALLLDQAQLLNQELQVQQEELRVSNEELEEQTRRLQESEERLKAQQEELQVINEELEEKNDLLERKHREVEHARREIAEKAEQVALASKYKSQFLANMSHELRSPLNSLLILARGLAENRQDNLTGDQVEAAQVIHSCGIDLLNLINEILDLAKIEAGRMDLRLGTVRVADLANGVRAAFEELARERGLDLAVVVTGEGPAAIRSDQKRVEQVIRNLLSNALKFTEEGSVTVTFGRPSSGVVLSGSGIAPDRWLAVAVEDTGIGIAPEQRDAIFQAFFQVDAGTARKHGGTGLGLSISKELATLLSGEIHVESEQGKGSTFILYLPVDGPEGQESRPVSTERTHRSAVRGTDFQQKATLLQIEDDREKLEAQDRVVLVIEDDPDFARILYKKCHEKGFKCLAAPTGEAGLELAGKYLPAAVILDIRLPGMDGWSVLAALKENTRTRHIPVHIVSVEGDPLESFRKGALGHVAKPLTREDIDRVFLKLEEVTTRKPWRVLVVEDDPVIRSRSVELIADADVIVDEVDKGAQALEVLRTQRYDCVVLDLGLPDISGGELLAMAESEGLALPPVVVHTARELTLDEEMQLREHAESIVIKDVRSQERLIDEVSLFLHRVVSGMPEKKRKIIRDLHDTDAAFQGKKVLIVDDDMRSTFALARSLTSRGMQTVKAPNGEKALELLDRQPDIDIVLMDIMMPVMDGYEAMKRIRSRERFRNLPILALTAKAMQEDRQKCIEAGASDYMPKPVDEGRLLSMMRVWLHR